jgi:hypothetical protein
MARLVLATMLAVSLLSPMVVVHISFCSIATTGCRNGLKIVIVKLLCTITQSLEDSNKEYKEQLQEDIFFCIGGIRFGQQKPQIGGSRPMDTRMCIEIRRDVINGSSTITLPKIQHLMLLSFAKDLL